jgi:hypothetical protein
MDGCRTVPALHFLFPSSFQEKQIVMGKLHEVLAVEKDLQGQANAIMTETAGLFAKQTAFNGSITTRVPFNEAEAHLGSEDREEVVTSVDERLEWTAQAVSRWLDVVLQKEATNQVAKADIKVGDRVIAQDVPATMLLGLETKLATFRTAVAAMPTLDSKRSWVHDATGKKGIWKTEFPDSQIQTRKVIEPIVLAEAVIKDGVGIPAQVKEVSKDIPFAKVTKTLFSGAVTSARKAEILGRIDTLIRAVKQARQRANNVDVVPAKIGDSLFGFILE